MVDLTRSRDFIVELRCPASPQQPVRHNNRSCNLTKLSRSGDARFPNSLNKAMYIK